MEDRHHGGHSVNQLEAEPQIDQHPGQRVEGCQKACLRKRADLGSDNIRRKDVEAGKVGALLKLVDDRRIRHPVQLVDAAEDTAKVFVAVIQNSRGLLGIFLRRLLRSPGARGRSAAETGSALPWLALSRSSLPWSAAPCWSNSCSAPPRWSAARYRGPTPGSLFAPAKSPPADVTLFRRSECGVMDAGAVDCLANPVEVWRLLELDVDQRAAAKIYSQLDAMPEKNRQDTRYAENQRKGEEVPLLP